MEQRGAATAVFCCLGGIAMGIFADQRLDYPGEHRSGQPEEGIQPYVLA